MAAAPSDGAAAAALGRALATRQENEEAVELLERARRLDPANARYAFWHGTFLWSREHWSAAAEALRAGLAISYDADCGVMLGQCCEQLGDREAALSTYVDIIRHAPDTPTGFGGLYQLLLDRDSPEEADAHATDRLSGLVIAPAMRTIGLARGLERHGRYPEARDGWLRARHQTEAADDPDVLQGLAHAHIALRELDAGERVLQQGLARHPDHVGLTAEYISLLEHRGEIDTLRLPHWQPIVRRLVMWSTPLHPDAAPVWDGSQPLDGKTVLFETYGGHGDILHACRFAKLMADRGAAVIIQSPPSLHSLLRTLPGIDSVIAPFDDCAPFDYQCLPSHAGVFQTWTLQDLRDLVPYLTGDPARRRCWASRFDTPDLHVGIAWQSRARESRDAYLFRSAPLAVFEPLGRIPGVRLHGLEVWPRLSDVSSARGWLTENLHLDPQDFGDAAAAIQELDVIVTIDTAIAHAAGALGRPCFMLLPYYPASFWMSAAPASADRSCGWYGSVRMFVQTEPGNWASAMTPVVEELRPRAAARITPTCRV